MTFRLALLVGLLAWIVTACGGTPADNVTSSEAAQPQQVAVSLNVEQEEPEQQTNPDAPEDVIAVVNGVQIPTEEFTTALERRRASFNAADEAALENFVLTTLINQEVTEQAAARMEIIVTDEDVAAEIAELKSLLDNDEAAWQQWLTTNGYADEAIFGAELREQLIVAQVRDEVVGDVPQQTTLQVQARHILVDSEEQATEIRQRIANGEDFVALAAQYSKDITTNSVGGDLGWFAREELLEPKVAEVAFTQEPGQISDPVATRLGYHIIETLQFDDLPVQPEKQAQIAQGIFDEWLATEVDSAIIEVYR